MEENTYRLSFVLTEADLESIARFLDAFSSHPEAVAVMLQAARTGNVDEALEILTELETVTPEQVDRVFDLLGRGMSALGELLSRAGGARAELAASIPVEALAPTTEG